MSDQRGPIGSAGDALIAHLVAQGYERAEPAVLQPAPLFLDLAGEDIRGRLYIMSSSGGMLTTTTARRYPVRALESGPAAGALMSAAHG